MRGVPASTVRTAPPRGRARQGASRLAALRRVPAACLACAAIGFAHAALWAVVTPVFQVPDEPAHTGYAQYVAETGRVPNGQGGNYSDEQAALILGLPFNIETKPSWFRSDRRKLFRTLNKRGITRSSPGESGVASNYPPLYYALEAIPYRVAYDANFVNRVFFMRLLSALMAGFTVAFVFLFLRELLPGTRWAWTVGALAVAFQPMVAYLGGGVTPDNLLFASSAALIWLLARAFHHGLTPRLGVAIGLAALAGVLTKQTTFGLLPGAALGVLLLVSKAPPERRGEALRGLVAAGLVLVVPFALWLAASYGIYDRSQASATAGFTNAQVSTNISLKGQVFYLWQVVFPPLPGMADQTPHYILWDVYVRGFIGRFGWFQFDFQSWVYRLGGAVVIALFGLAGIALVRGREAVRARWPEALTYAALAAGMFFFVEVAAYRYRSSSGQFFEQTRYLFPLLAFYGAVVALAARGVGRRWGPAAGAFMVVLFMGHSLFSMFLSIGRWYA
jgi:4-amino-4-deoxy-L-arabinose transferase-like glycosyltransferase